MTRLLLTAAAVTICLMGRLGPVTAAGDHYWELGAGSYQGAVGETPVDAARWDWSALSEMNNDLSPQGLREHVNESLKLNPKQKYTVELWPLYGLESGPGSGPGGVATFLDYHFKPEMRAEMQKRIRASVQSILENIAKPENVYGFSLGEEVPGCFGVGEQFGWSAHPDEMPPLLEKFRAEIEKERGKPLVWDDESRLWVGKVFADALAEIHQTIREAGGPRRKVIYWAHSGYCYLDDRGQPGGPAANAPIGRQGLYPCAWADILRPGLVNTIMGLDDRMPRIRNVAERFNVTYFSQLDHPVAMRLNSWADSVAEAKFKDTRNLGYFFYCDGNCNKGAWNDDSSFSAAPAENAGFGSITEHERRFCAQEKIGIDIVTKCLAPTVQASMSLGAASAHDLVPINALVHNPALESFYLTPPEAVAREVQVTLTLPAGCRVDPRYSPAATLKLGDMAADGWKAVSWLVTVDGPPAGGKYELALTVTSANHPAVVQRYPGDATIAAFQPQEFRRSVTRWAESALDGPAVKPWVTFQALGEPVKGPAISDGGTTLSYQGLLQPGRRLLFSPDGRARLLNWYLMKPEAMSKPNPNDPTGYTPVTDTYGAGGKYLGQPLGDIKKLKITFEGQVAEGTGALVTLAFGNDKGVVWGPQLGGLGEKWGEVSTVVDVPPDATRLDRIYLWRGGNKGKIWYGKLSVMTADLPPEGQDVTICTTGRTPTIPGGSFSVLTYTDQELPAWQPKIRVQLWKEEPK